MAHRREELVEVIREVRRRYRRRLAARGALIVLGGTLLALLISASGLETLRFSAPAIIAFRLLVFAVFAVLGLYAFVRPLRREVNDGQVALYLEETNPSLEAAILSAVEASAVAHEAHSQQLVEKLVEQAIDQSRQIDHTQSDDHKAFQRHVLTVAGIVAAVALIIALGPSYLRSGLSALLLVQRSAEASTPYKIIVTPGDAKVPRGGDQSVHAKLEGFQSKNVS